MCNKISYNQINDKKDNHNYKTIFSRYILDHKINGNKYVKLGSSVVSLSIYKEWLSCHYPTINYKMAFSFVLYSLRQLMKLKKINIDTEPLQLFIQEL